MYLVHEGVDDRVGDVIGEVEVENDDVAWNETEGHEERRAERDNEDDSDDEQHDGGLQVRHQSSIRLRPRRLLLLRRRLCFRTMLHDTVMLSSVQSFGNWTFCPFLSSALDISPHRHIERFLLILLKPKH